MINIHDMPETIEMIDEEYLDVRIITIGIFLLDCCDSDIGKSCEKIHSKITRLTGNLVKTGEDIEWEYGILIINKWISAIPIVILVAVSGGDSVKRAHTLERCTQAVGVSFTGGYSALVQKGCVAGDRELMESIPGALAEAKHVCTSINVDSTKAGINMNAVELTGCTVREVAELTKGRNCVGAAKLVVFCNVLEDNPFMAGILHGVGEADCAINVGVSGPGVVRVALAKADKSLPVNELADIIKKTAFKVIRTGQLVGTLASEHLGVPFGIVDLLLTPTPAIGDSVTHILEEVGLESCGAYGTTTCLVMLNDAVRRGGVMVSSTVGGLSGAFIPMSEDVGMTAAIRAGTLCPGKLEAMTAMRLVDLDMAVIPGETTPEVISGIIADETVIGMANSKTTAVRAIPAIGKKVGKELEFGGLLESDPAMNINQTDCSVMIHREGRVPAPIQALKN